MESPNHNPIAVESKENAAIIRFSRPKIKNPLSAETLDILEKEFRRLEMDEAINGIIFTGTGNTFAAGANLNEVAQLNGISAREFGLRGQILMQIIYRSRKKTVAAINGFCMGGGLDLAVACKMRIATPNAVFAHPGVSLGIITGWGGTQLLPRLIGPARSLELFLTGRNVKAEEALRFGLIDEISENPLARSVSELTE
jgi:enoyl-CoA hydratase